MISLSPIQMLGVQGESTLLMSSQKHCCMACGLCLLAAFETDGCLLVPPVRLPQSRVTSHHTLAATGDDLLRRFWEIEKNANLVSGGGGGGGGGGVGLPLDLPLANPGKLDDEPACSKNIYPEDCSAQKPIVEHQTADSSCHYPRSPMHQLWVRMLCGDFCHLSVQTSDTMYSRTLSRRCH